MSQALRATPSVLLVEDNDVDVEAVRRAFRRASLPLTLHSARDGVEALAMLRGDGEKPVVEEPFLILLDINMPRMDGMELLHELRADEGLKQSIVFMLTTSDRDRDVAQAYEHNVAGYFLKDDLSPLIQTLSPYCQGNTFPG
jgi:CheY-like chemotaxis protein